MKKYLFALAVAIGLFGSIASAQTITGANLWKLVSGNHVVPVVSSWIVGNSSTNGAFNNVTITGSCTGCSGAGSGTVATSSLETAGQIPYWTTTSGYPAKIGSIATGTLFASGPLSVSVARQIIGGNATLSISQSGASTDGYLSSIDWNTFNGKDSFSYPFPASATSSPLMFLASSTIGNGTQAGGLTLNGGATTTGSSLIGGSILYPNSLLTIRTTHTAGTAGISFGVGDVGSSSSSPLLYSYKVGTGNTGAFTVLGLNYYLDAGGTGQKVDTSRNVGVLRQTPVLPTLVR